MRMKRRANYVRCVRAAGIASVVLCALGGAVLAGSLVYEAPGLRIAHLYVSGCEDAIAEEVLGNAEAYRNENILAADLRALQRRIESNPWIKQAVVRRQYPDTVSIEISVREARAIIALDEPFLVDGSGFIFSRASEHCTGIPVLHGLQQDDFTDDPETAARMITDGLRILACLQANAFPVDDNVSLTCVRETGYTLQMGPGEPRIYLGFNNYQQKLSALPRMLADLRSRGLTARSIHLHSSERAFVKLSDRDGSDRQARAGYAVGVAIHS
jgi:cell division protein FtsQ